MRFTQPVLMMVVVAGLAITSLSIADAQPPQPQAKAPVYAPAANAQEAADQKEVLDAIAAMNAGRYAGLEPHLPALRAVLDHAPASFPLIEKRGSVTILRADGPEFGARTLLIMAEAATAHQTMSVQRGVNTYPMASFMLGSYANEKKQFDEAIRLFDRGLALQPDFAPLMSEKGFALGQLKRPADALAMYERGLQSPMLPDANRALMLRGRGYALIELHRLDEAEQAYLDSQKFDATSPIAHNELQYIAQQRQAVR